MSYWSRNLSVNGDRGIGTVLSLSFGLSLSLSLLWLIPKASNPFSPIQKQGKKLLRLHPPDMCSNMSKKGLVQHLPEDACSIDYERFYRPLISRLPAHLARQALSLPPSPSLHFKTAEVNTTEERRDG